tara:strand:+ start:4674 stop:5603 length:930 start_codon:yes stop_codon:yes gene_type:complete
VIKKLFIIVLLSLISNNLFASDKIIISLVINNEPITNLDILNEVNYLIALNTSIKNLDKKEILSIAKDSLIKEKVKELELTKHFDLNEENKYVDNILKNIFSNLNLNNKEELKEYLSKYKINLNDLVYKINIEARWNELIFKTYSNKIDINFKEMENKLKKQKKEMIDVYQISEILFNVEKKSDLKDAYNKIKTNIDNNGFQNTAKIYSLSNTASSGGKVGWVNKNNLSSSILNEIKNLKINQHSKPISIPGGYLILKIEDKKKEKPEIKNFEEELNKLISLEKERKLNQFSIIHFSKVKKNTEIIYEN